MHIGILMCGHVPDQVRDTSGAYGELFAKLLDGHGFTFTVWNVVDGVFPDHPEEADGWLVTGSKYGAYEDLPWIPPLENLIRRIVAIKRPMIGVCFGHQIIAQALGGRVAKFSGGWGVGRHAYTYAGKEVNVNAWHQDQVVDLPPGARVIASSDFCANAALRVDNDVWTIQAHPEFDSKVVDTLIKVRGPGLIPDDLLSRATAQLEAPTDRMRIAADMAAFFKGELPA